MNVVDHCIVVNARRGIIVESEERVAFLLSVEGLAACGSADATELKFEEIRDTVVQEESNNLKKRKSKKVVNLSQLMVYGFAYLVL